MKHSWTAHDFAFAYYVAKWGWYGISQNLDYWAYSVIGTTPRSLDMQIKKYKRLINGHGEFTNFSDLQIRVFRWLERKPMSYTRDRVEELRKGLIYNNRG